MKVSERRKLGSADLKVPVMGFGGAPLGNLYAGFSDEQAHETVRTAYDLGLRFFDTAPLYGFGLSEHRIGETLRWLDRDSYVLSTKVGRLLHAKDPKSLDGGLFKDTLPFEGVYDYSYDGAMRSIEASLARIGTHRIDVLLIHDVDIWTHGSEEARLQRFRECMDGGAYKALVEMREQGVVKAIGAGINEVAACEAFARAGDFDTFLLAGRYTLLEQGALDSLLPLCAEKDVSLMIGGPYNTGILATGAVEGAYYNYELAPADVMERVARIERVCKAHGVRLASAALQFPLLHPRVASIIPGGRNRDEIVQNKAIFEAPIPVDFWKELKHEGLLREDAPVG
ncbi:MAG: aldo/keto reductase [Geminicoccaceae bacterium]|nr:aldo/keto reductase [Geminicoccaceae bacterium]